MTKTAIKTDGMKAVVPYSLAIEAGGFIHFSGQVPLDQATGKLVEGDIQVQTRQVLDQLLEDTEMDHAYWLEKQLSLIERMGLENYLQTLAGGA